MASYLQRVVRAWETVQVELHGRYSLGRFRHLIDDGKQSTKLWNLLVVLLTPLPCTLVLLIMEILPIRPPELGYANQTVWLNVRLWALSAIMVFMQLTQVHQSSPTLPLSRRRSLGIAAFSATAFLVEFYVVSAIIVFPCPFVLQVLAVPGSMVLVLAVWLSWKDALRADSDAKQRLIRYLPVPNTMFLLPFVYPLFAIAFTRASPAAQPYISLALPVMKLVFRNIMSKGVFHMEDLAPTTIVFNLDIFHGLIMVVDLVQSLLALYDIDAVVRRVTTLENACQLLERGKTDSSLLMFGSRRAIQRGSLHYALFLVDNCPAIRDHPDVVLPRHLRLRVAKSSRSVMVASRSSVILQQIVPVDRPARKGSLTPSSSHSELAPSPASDNTLPELTPTERLQLECVQNVLKMLHMVEFFVLIEFVEVLIAFINTVYMAVIAYLPNRAYYWQLALLSNDALRARVHQAAIYTALELVSFVLFCYAVDRKLRYLSSIQQLAFVLRRHVLIVQAATTMWVLYIVQLSFEHFGADFTFRFEWLQKPTVGTSRLTGSSAVVGG